jgi:hypothetical protein
MPAPAYDSRRPRSSDADAANLPRRQFLAGSMMAACSSAIASVPALSASRGFASEAATGSAESLVAALHATLTPAQREKVCHPWDYVHPTFGLLRTRVGNNWNCTDTDLSSAFFTAEQKQLVREIFEQLISPEWHGRFDRQLEDDTGGFGHQQSIAILGDPGKGPSQFLLTGRHMTLRCDGDSADHVAFGGPIFYGHDAGGFNEEKDHPGNVFWPQAVAANAVFAMLDGKQREASLVEKAPRETAIAFRGAALHTAEPPSGIAVTDLSTDQQGELSRVLGVLLEPFRGSDRAEVRRCLAKQGGLDGCRLLFYKEGDIGNDGVWDNWRLEGPAFVWHFRGAPHVHVFVNIADDPSVPTNA